MGLTRGGRGVHVHVRVYAYGEHDRDMSETQVEMIAKQGGCMVQNLQHNTTRHLNEDYLADKTLIEYPALLLSLEWVRWSRQISTDYAAGSKTLRV